MRLILICMNNVEVILSDALRSEYAQYRSNHRVYIKQRFSSVEKRGTEHV